MDQQSCAACVCNPGCHCPRLPGAESAVLLPLNSPLLHPPTHASSAAMGGPLEILEALTPVMSGTVLLLSLVWERLWVTLPASIYFESLRQTGISMGLILVGAIIAFLLVRALLGRGYRILGLLSMLCMGPGARQLTLSLASGMDGVPHDQGDISADVHDCRDLQGDCDRCVMSRGVNVILVPYLDVKLDLKPTVAAAAAQSWLLWPSWEISLVTQTPSVWPS